MVFTCLPLAWWLQRVNLHALMSPKKLGRYELIRVLGKGAMGLVYEGRDPNLDRRVAIKTIKVENLSDSAAAEYEVRFRTEARSAARLQHPNIVSVYDSDRDGDMAFLVMEFVEGDDLKHHLDKGAVYTLQQTLSIMADLLSALSYAHSQKIVHRDIKPANLLVQASGSIKLADFGVARIQDSGDATRTQGSIVGTLKYMSPEQLEGRPIDARADLFAAAVVLYQLLTSQRPFDGDSDFAVIQKIVNHTPTAATFYNPKLPPAIDAVMAKALAKSRDMRYESAQDFLAALQAACKDVKDTSIAPQVIVPAKGSNLTWTATIMSGESLVTTEPGVTSGTSTSLVTQEVELVYWKDIKESIDTEDIQGFLAKFPSGIYADLARRRLKNLTATTQIEPTVVSPRVLKPLATDAEEALWLPKRRRVEAETRFAATTSSADANRQTAPASTAQAAPAASPRKSVWLVAGLAALAVAGGAFQLLSSPSAAPNPLAPIASASSAAPQRSASEPALPVQSAAPAVVPAADPVAEPVLAAPVLATASAPRPAASAAGNAVRTALPASKAAASLTAKKAAPDKDISVKEEVTPPPDSSPKTVRSAPVAAAALPTARSSPRAACEDRMLLGFQICMAEQCARPAFTQHPICVERRAMDERRREEQRSRQ